MPFGDQYEEHILSTMCRHMCKSHHYWTLWVSHWYRFTQLTRNDTNSCIVSFLKRSVGFKQDVQFYTQMQLRQEQMRWVTSINRVILKGNCLFYLLWLCFTPLSTIFKLYHGCQFYWRETRGSGENHQPIVMYWQPLSHSVVHITLIEIRTHNISGDKHWLRR